jgi:integrase
MLMSRSSLSGFVAKEFAPELSALLAELPYHIQVMVMTARCLGLRVSEIRALQWQDRDLKRRILTLARSIVGKYVWNGGKTGASEDEVALDSKLVSVLPWRTGRRDVFRRQRAGYLRMLTRSGQCTAM